MEAKEIKLKRKMKEIKLKHKVRLRKKVATNE